MSTPRPRVRSRLLAAAVAPALLTLSAAAAVVTAPAAPAAGQLDRPVVATAWSAPVSPAAMRPAATRKSASCDTATHYVNSSGHCVQRPTTTSANASAECRDGSYSHSEHRQGTCSGHGGVARWISL